MIRRRASFGAASYRAGSPSVDGVLDDYAGLIGGLLDLYQAGFDVHWLKWAVSLQEKQDQIFGDAKEGGYFDAGSSDPSLLSRTRESYDDAEPSPNSTAAMNLLRLAQFTDRAEWRDRAQKNVIRIRCSPPVSPRSSTGSVLRSRFSSRTNETNTHRR